MTGIEPSVEKANEARPSRATLKTGRKSPDTAHMTEGWQPMQFETSATWPPAGIGIASRRACPGKGRLEPAEHHRIIIHTSPSTRSFCLDTGSSFLRTEGHIDFIPSNHGGGFDASAPYECLEVSLAPGLLDRVAVQTGSLARFEARHMLRDERIYHLARALESNRAAYAAGDVLYADSIGIALAARLLGLQGTQPAASRLSSAQMKRLLDYIEAHLDRPLTTETLSRVAGASNSHLRSWFKVATGTTLHRYVLRRRVERARLLLVEGHMSTSEVAFAVGFAHQSHLARWMRRELGVPPSHIRRAGRPSENTAAQDRLLVD
ncbi:MAG: helix-turn-helix transcriptional regulator [Sphingomonas sp.]|uniref:AraC family transcriptional regulator n=1 Tax=Sphingomonas sp. TaxID=28214 RepID=UPI001B18690F|nr:AraC family transcriptional regulator [Sphingomonas sp.]MBO9621544.1 helix-turn-helix transcriptional regulator [Sphingomonas sp.]